MLDSQSLSQLKELKQQIDAQKERAEGVIKATQGRFGFVVLDDKREIFLPPEQMLRVFPGDRVAITIQSKGDKTVAELEKLLHTPIERFTGKVVKKGEALFVEPDLQRFNRWLFIPPSSRKGINVGDYVECKLQRHPFKQGKPQAKVTALIGDASQPGIEADYVTAKYTLGTAFPAAELPTTDLEQDTRQDLCQLPFVTIDAETTLDMDDALYAEPGDNGWTLWVAIADPTAFIPPGSPWEAVARQRGGAVYLPGRTVSMLPEAIAHDRCSLVADAERPALVAQLAIDAQGCVSRAQFISATVRSRAKLSYQQVADALDGKTDAAPAQHGALGTLQAVTQALREQRRRQHLVMPDRPQYRLQLDAQQKIAQIQREAKTAAHTIVEEAMVAVNRSAAERLQSNDGLFVGHAGFRTERLGDVKKLIKECLPDYQGDARTPEGYIQLMQACDKADTPLPLRSIFSRWLERSRLCRQARPHFGMGLSSYTTITSPLRRYSDFSAHRLLKAVMGDTATAAPDDDALAELQQRNENNQRAQQEAEQWLKCQYLERNQAGEFSGEIVQINSNGFTVRLDATGINGFVDMRNGKQKPRFTAHRLQLGEEPNVYQLEQKVTVRVARVDSEGRTIDFALVPAAANCHD